jgi:ADP-heptose:LPS heptosyltransferase
LTFAAWGINISFEAGRRSMFLKNIERLGKELVFYFLSLFVRSEKIKREDVDLGSIKKILIVRQDDRIGNLILTTPLLSALRKRFPQARIWYLASKTFHTLFSNSHLVDRILVAKKKQYIVHPLSLIWFIRKIRKEKFDLAFDASDENNFSFNNTFLVYLSRSRYRIGYQKPQSHLFLNMEVTPSGINKHASELHLDLLRYLAGNLPSEELCIEINPQKSVETEKYLKEHGVESSDFLVGMHIGGRGEKRWEAENFQKLADWITDSFDAKVIFLWGPEERDIIKHIHPQGKQIIAELFPLPVLSVLINRCNIIISPDTGAMHVSAAVGTPTLALFLNSDPVKYGPRGEKHRIVKATNGVIPIETVKNEFEKMIISHNMTRLHCSSPHFK